jgi:hypothetical protein
MSEARVKCVPSTMIMGVGCGKSYIISNPMRIFNLITPIQGHLKTVRTFIGSMIDEAPEQVDLSP